MFLMFLYATTYSSPIHQFYGGIGNLRHADNTIFMPQIGYFKLNQFRSIVFGIENNFYYQNKNYNWPDVGNYNYKRVVNMTSYSFGFHLWKRRKFNCLIGISVNHSIFYGKLKTNSETIKSYLLKDYNFSIVDPYLLLKANYRINKRFDVYLKYNRIKISKEILNYRLFNFGINYNLYSNYDF